MESKRHTSYRCYSTNVYRENHWSTALKLLGKTARTQIILSPKSKWTLHYYIYLEDNTAYSPKYWWHNGAQNKNQKTPKTRNTVRYSVSNKQKPSTIPSRKCNNCIWASVVQLGEKNLRDIESVKIEKFKFELDKLKSWFLMSQKCPTMSSHQEATASSTSSLILGLKEFTYVLESPTRPWSSLSCFETTPSIQVSAIDRRCAKSH